MTSDRRRGTEKSATRGRILDAVVQIMLEDGYAAVTSRSVADRVGVKAPLIHYYFASVDELFIAAFRRRADHRLEQLMDELQREEPLQVLWRYANDKSHVALTLEFLALSNHRKSIRAEIAAVAERFRSVQLGAFTSALVGSDLDPDEYPASALLLAMMSIPTTIVLEESLGMSTGHSEATMLIERFVAQLRDAKRSSSPQSDTEPA